ncbi:kallikrein-14-like [Morphnus guianensis]
MTHIQGCLQSPTLKNRDPQPRRGHDPHLRGPRPTSPGATTHSSSPREASKGSVSSDRTGGRDREGGETPKGLESYHDAPPPPKWVEDAPRNISPSPGAGQRVQVEPRRDPPVTGLTPLPHSGHGDGDSWEPWSWWHPRVSVQGGGRDRRDRGGCGGTDTRVPGPASLAGSSVAGDNRVVGGMDCEPHSQPWQVAILDMYKLYCGGVLVARQWVVTAAHCTTPGITSTHLGKHNLYTREWGEVQKMVQKFVPHPNYNPTTKDNDIMLMKLLTPVTLTNRIQPIAVASCLPDPGTTCVTSGWGATTSPEVSYPDVLQCVNVTIFSTAECQQLYPGSITENMLCAGSLQGGRDSCQGDSGGPLVCNRTLQGIVSWGMEKCGQPKRPGVYTKVCRYAQWIQKTMKDNE